MKLISRLWIKCIYVYVCVYTVGSNQLWNIHFCSVTRAQIIFPWHCGKSKSGLKATLSLFTYTSTTQKNLFPSNDLVICCNEKHKNAGKIT